MANTTSGTRNTTPIARPSSRWAYSHQKIGLNSESVIAWLTCLNSGVCRYFANAACQSASLIGGSVPTIGCHSTIDKPECVRRVTPPTTIIANTSAQQTRSQAATGRLPTSPAAFPGTGTNGVETAAEVGMT